MLIWNCKVAFLPKQVLQEQVFIHLIVTIVTSLFALINPHPSNIAEQNQGLISMNGLAEQVRETRPVFRVF